MTDDKYDAQVSSEANRRMRAESGRVDDFRPLVALFYELGRDLVPLGEFEGRVDRILEHAKPDDAGERGPFMFTNGWLARWAQDLADRLADADRDVEA